MIGHNFLVKLDNLCFPKILNFKNKSLPDKQLLRLKNWFIRYDFTVQYIKGDKNLIPDLFTRPPSNIILITPTSSIPVIAMTSSLLASALTKKSFPMNLTFHSLHQIQDFAKKISFQVFHKHLSFPTYRILQFPSWTHLPHWFYP